MAKRSHNERAEQARDFFRRLARDGLFAPIFVLWGAERFLVDEAVARVQRAAFPDGDDTGFNLERWHASECTGIDVASAAQMLPMFAPRRVVILRGAQALKAAEWPALVAYAEDPSPSTVMVIEATKLDGRTKAVQSLLRSSNVHAVEFPELRANDVRSWVARRAGDRGLEVARDVPEYLVDAIGTSLQLLDQALERIDLFLAGDGERRVTIDAIRPVIPDTRAHSVFELTDALAAGSLADAMRCFHRMMELGESPVGAVSMIGRQFRQLLLVRDGASQGLSGRELASHAGVPPFRLDDYVRSARRFDERRLASILSATMRTDHALKSSRLRDELIVERLLITICAPAAAA